jgi:hypothetical protein
LLLLETNDGVSAGARRASFDKPLLEQKSRRAVFSGGFSGARLFGRWGDLGMAKPREWRSRFSARVGPLEVCL